MSSVAAIRQHCLQLINAHADISPCEIRRIFTEAIREQEMKQGWNESSKGEPWTDDQLRLVLSAAPTKENCLKHARALGRGFGSIEQVYRWALSTDEAIKTKRPDDAFVAQIKRVAKQLGWRA